MFDPYMQMLSGANMTPETQQNMQRMMLAQALMGGGSAMAQSGSQGGGPGSFSRSLAQGVMGGMQGANDAFSNALRYQQYMNQQQLRSKQDEHRIEREKLADQRWEREFKADEAYRKESLAARNPWAGLMGDVDPMGQPVDTKPPTLGETVESRVAAQQAAQAATSMEQEVDSWKKNWLDVRRNRRGRISLSPQPIDTLTTPQQAQTFASEAQRYYPHLSDKDKEKLVRHLINLKQKFNINIQ